jgi:chromate reductase, NAD(P)H dehydrogenase (quinone)
MRILAISGSLRAQSTNSAVIRAAAKLAPPGMEVVVYRDLAALPHFNADLEGDAPPEPVAALRRHIGRAQGLLICSPEYARGVPGALKNALDWLVGSVEFPDIPVALINASPRSTSADAQLRLTLATMSARLVEAASITLPLLGQGFDADAIVADATIAGQLRAALAALARAVAVTR